MDNRTDYFHEGVSAFQQNSYTKAITLFENALAEPFCGFGNMSDDLIYNNIATCYNKLMNYSKAAEFYEKAIKKGLVNDDIYFSLAATYHKSSENEKALSIYNFLIDRTPNNGKAYYIRGKLYEFMSKRDSEKAKSLNYFV